MSVDSIQVLDCIKDSCRGQSGVIVEWMDNLGLIFGTLYDALLVKLGVRPEQCQVGHKDKTNKRHSPCKYQSKLPVGSIREP